MLHFEAIGMLITNIKERFNQKTVKLIIDVEEFLLLALNLEATLETDEYNNNLKIDGMIYYKNGINLPKLKSELVNLRAFLKQELRGDLSNFYYIFNFFKSTAKTSHKCKILLPNMWILIRLIIINPVIISSCKHSFKLNKIPKIELRSTMKDERMNHLCFLKHCKELLIEVKIEDIIIDFITNRDRRFSTFSKVSK